MRGYNPPRNDPELPETETPETRSRRKREHASMTSQIYLLQSVFSYSSTHSSGCASESPARIDVNGVLKAAMDLANICPLLAEAAWDTILAAQRGWLQKSEA
jgi:hypothetical protein